MVKPQVGDVIFATRAVYNHYGIYSGHNKVIHYCKVNESFCDGEICETSLEEFLDGDTLHICNFDRTFWEDKVKDLVEWFTPCNAGKILTRRYKQEHRKESLNVFSPEDTVRRARSKIGTHDYSLFGNNCEHFAMWCKTGLKLSEQV